MKITFLFNKVAKKIQDIQMKKNPSKLTWERSLEDAIGIDGKSYFT